MSNDGQDQDKKTEGTVQVIDFNRARAERLEEKRQSTQRIFFSQILGIYCVLGDERMKPIEIVDVSEDGIAFRVPFNASNPWPREKGPIPVRFYFSSESYLPVIVTVVNSRPVIDQGTRYIRYGCSVDKTVTSYEAFRQFVCFLREYSVHAHQDTGSQTKFYL